MRNIVACAIIWATATCAFAQAPPGPPIAVVPPFLHSMPTDQIPVEWTDKLPDPLRSDKTLMQLAASIRQLFPSRKAVVAFGESIEEEDTHLGVDIALPEGMAVHALAAGTIVMVSYSDAFGNFVVVDHGNNLYSVYGHLSEFASLRHRGDKVAFQQVLGYAGITGSAKDSCVHLAIIKNGQYLDPLGIESELK